MITGELLAQAANIQAGLAARWSAALDGALFEFGILTPARVAALIGQIRIESGDFARTAESMNYAADRVVAIFPRVKGEARVRLVAVARKPGEAALNESRQRSIANIVYAGVNGNGDEASGDGWNFRGSGLLQHTGRGNFADVKEGIGTDVIGAPDRLRTDVEVMARAACWRWYSAGLNAAADAGNYDAITRNINGPAMLEKQKRADFSIYALSVLRGKW